MALGKSLTSGFNKISNGMIEFYMVSARRVETHMFCSSLCTQSLVQCLDKELQNSKCSKVLTECMNTCFCAIQAVASGLITQASLDSMLNQFLEQSSFILIQILVEFLLVIKYFTSCCMPYTLETKIWLSFGILYSRFCIY